MNVSKAVLITGCSSGIGRATAEHLSSVGWKVYATARNPRSRYAVTPRPTCSSGCDASCRTGRGTQP